MEINKHIVCDEADAPKLYRYVKENKIQYKNLRDDDPDSAIVFDIYESSPHWSCISEQIEKNKVFCISETIFTKEELQSAEWLAVRSQWRCGYPQPEENFEYETITYSSENHCNECGIGLVQTDSFRIRKTPRWGQRHFMMLNWVEDELFLSETAQILFQKEGFTDISFIDVKNKTGKEILPEIRQLVIRSTLPQGIIEDQRCIREVLVCPKCSMKRYHANGIGMYAFKKEIFENAPDIVKTAEFFGWGHYSLRLILVNQKVYRAIVANHLERGLEFSPIELV